MRLIAKVIRIWCAKFHCNRLTTGDSTLRESHFLAHSVYYLVACFGQLIW